MKTHLPEILITGTIDDFEVRANLIETLSHASTISWKDLIGRVSSDAATMDQDLANADLIVIVQIRRGEYAQSEIEALAAVLPLAALVVVYGPWCEGETRSGQPLLDVVRIAISNWPLAFSRFMSEFRQHGTSRWHQPPIVSDLQRLLDPLWKCKENPLPSTDRELTVAIASRDRISAESLVNVVEDFGWKAMIHSDSMRTNAPGVLVVDCYFSIDEAINVVNGAAHALPVVAILGFARQSDRDKLAALVPESMVIGKPFSNEDLLQAILRVTRTEKGTQLI